MRYWGTSSTIISSEARATEEDKERTHKYSEKIFTAVVNPIANWKPSGDEGLLLICWLPSSATGVLTAAQPQRFLLGAASSQPESSGSSSAALQGILSDVSFTENSYAGPNGRNSSGHSSASGIEECGKSARTEGSSPLCFRAEVASPLPFTVSLQEDRNFHFPILLWGISHHHRLLHLSRWKEKAAFSFEPYYCIKLVYISPPCTKHNPTLSGQWDLQQRCPLHTVAEK